MNRFLRKMGFSETDRVVVFHADDIGMCHASVEAYAELLDRGPLSSAATMVPCPWFPAAARHFVEQAENPKLDVGVHLTITSEWDDMRWGPLSTGDAASGLLDGEGYFYRDVESAQSKPTLAALEVELRAQIERALAAGIDMTHIDTHMGTMMCGRYLPLYVDLAFEYGVPALLPQTDVEGLVAMGYGRDSAETLAQFTKDIETRGMPLFDTIEYLPLGNPYSIEGRFQFAQDKLNNLGPGLHFSIIHPSTDTAELRAIAPDWQARVGDYELFRSDQWQDAVEASGAHVIGMKALRDAM